MPLRNDTTTGILIRFIAGLALLFAVFVCLVVCLIWPAFFWVLLLIVAVCFGGSPLVYAMLGFMLGASVTRHHRH